MEIGAYINKQYSIIHLFCDANLLEYNITITNGCRPCRSRASFEEKNVLPPSVRNKTTMQN